MFGVFEAVAGCESRPVEKSGSMPLVSRGGCEIGSEGGKVGAAQTSMASATLNDGEVGQINDGSGLGYSFPV